uniref:Uncharacterized protein n=1 Tax=Timema cristinae TaxID=61476 RepID=A0A7R9DBT2_TIMCR|nr:unnamed protein product [Timema cristinae]
MISKQGVHRLGKLELELAGNYHVEDPKPSSLSGIKIFLLMLVGTLAVIACVVIGIMFYQKHQENSRKRFY